MTTPRTLVFGGALMDFVRQQGGWQSRPGGSAWNVALALARLGAGPHTVFAGSLGTDPFGDEIAAQGQAAGLEMRFATRVDANTALSVVHSAHPARYAFYAQGGADSAFRGVPAAAWEGAQAAYFGGVTLLRAPADLAFLAAAAAACERGVTVLYDPNFRPAYAEQQRAALHEYLPLTSLLKVSEEDLIGLLPGLNLESGIAELLRINPELNILLTLGENGAQFITAGQAWAHPGYQVEVADTVGAGDASAAGLLYALLYLPETSPPRQLAFALACGALACTRHGAFSPTLAEVQQFFPLPTHPQEQNT